MTVTTRTRATRALFHFDWRDGLDKYGALVARSGQAITFDRGGTAGAATAVDRNGRVYTPGYKTPRFHHRYSATSGLWEPCGVLLEGSRANLVVQSDALATTWTNSGGAVPTNNVGTYAGISFSRIASASLGSILQNVTFTGDGVKAVSFCCKYDGDVGPFYVQLYDNSASALRLRLDISFTSGGVASATANVGTLLATESLGNGVYRFLASTTSVTAANQNILYASGTPGPTGATWLVSRYQAENAAFPSSIIPTAASTVTRAADAMSAVFNAVPGAMTVYVKMVDFGVGRGPSVIQISNPAADATRLAIYDNGTNDGQVYGQYYNGTVANSPLTYLTSSLGDTREFSLYLAASGKAGIIESINGATATDSGLFGTAAEFTPSFSGQLITLFSGGAYQQVKIAAGVQTLAQMRAL